MKEGLGLAVVNPSLVRRGRAQDLDRTEPGQDQGVPPLPHGIVLNVALWEGYTHPINRQTPVKTLHSRILRNAGGKNPSIDRYQGKKQADKWSLSIDQRIKFILSCILDFRFVVCRELEFFIQRIR